MDEATSPSAWRHTDTTVADIIKEWTGRHHATVANICDALLVGTRLVGDAAQRADATDWTTARLVPGITDATKDRSLIQIGLSECLANRGILPMFGFPTRARLLYHKQPANWPPRQVVDCDLELAVSMFAPGAKTVKERTIHTAIGVAHYRPQEPRAVEVSNPLRPPVRIGWCGNRQHVETATPDVPACPVCASPAGPDERDYHPMDLRQPKGLSAISPKRATMMGCSISCRAPRGLKSVGRPSLSRRT